MGYLAVDTQRWSFTQRLGMRKRRWSETKLRYRLDLLTTWNEGFLTPDDEDALARGRFDFKGEALTYQELTGAEKGEIFSQRFSDWD